MDVVIPFAHLGHVLIDLPVFLGPVAAVSAWIWVTMRRERRRTDTDAARNRPRATDRGPAATR